MEILNGSNISYGIIEWHNKSIRIKFNLKEK
jgi:hypothetical protein